MATILKNNIKPGGSTLKGLVVTDESGNQRDVKFVRQVDSNGVATTLYDTFDHYEYSEITVTANHTYNGDVGANGSAVAVATAPTYKQTRWSVGHSGAKYDETTLTSGATITYSGTHVASDGTVSGSSLGTTPVARNTSFASSVATISMNGKSVNTSGVAVAQAANAKTGTGNYNGFTQACYQAYTEYQVVSFASVGDIPAYGGTSYAQGTGQSRTNYKGSSYTKYEIHDIFTSGDHKHNGTYTTASGWTDGNTPSAGAWGGNTTVKGSDVSGTSLGKTTTTAKTNKGNSTTTWNGVACSAAIYQAINSKSSTAATALNSRTQACYKAVTEYQIINFASTGDVPASGGKSKGQGTGQSRTNYSTSSYTKYDYYFTWTAYAGDSNAKEYSYSNTASGWTDGSAPAAGAWGSNTTVTGSEVSGSNLTTTAKARTKLGTSSVTWNGKTASADIYQAANVRNTSATHYSTSAAQTTYRYRISGTTSVPDIPVTGGTVHATFQVQRDAGTYYIYYYGYYYTSGSRDGDYTSNSDTTWNNSYSNYTTVAGSDVSGSNLTTTATSRTKKGTSSYSGGYGSGSADIYQAANTYSDSWNAPSISAYSYTSSSFAAAGGSSSSPTVTVTQSGTRTFATTSTTSISNSSFTYSYSMSATGFSVNSSTGVVTAGNNTGAARSGTVTVTVTGAGKTATKTYTFSQAEDPYGGIEYVNLGLPSGLKFAKCAIGSSSPTEKTTKYYAWALPQQVNYTGNLLEDADHRNIYYQKSNMTDAQDIACISLGKGWRTPYKTEFEELINNTTNKEVSAVNAVCQLFTSKNNSNTLTLPKSGTVSYPNNDWGYYWSRNPTGVDASVSSAYALHVTYSTMIETLAKRTATSVIPIHA